jgi:hypothetical protein
LEDVLAFVKLGVRSQTLLAAENLFLRKQLALYQERRIKPRRPDPATRVALVLLSRWLDWRSILTVKSIRTAGKLYRRTRPKSCMPSATAREFQRAAPVARLIYEGLVSFKHPAFAEEGEWRLIQQGRIQRRAVCRSAFRTRGGRIVSYTPLIFHGQPIPDGGGHPRPNDFPVASITCGPTLDAEGAQRALRMLLEHLGFEANGVEITSSNIPFAT